MTPFARGAVAIVLVASIASASPALAATPRETLIRAAFATRDKAQALALVNEAIGETQAILSRDPNNREAKLQQALGIGYRGQLKRSPTDAKATYQQLSQLVASDPRDPEAEVALAGWHLTAVGDLGGFLARTVLGANRDKGLSALDRAVSLGGGRAFFPAYAALIRIRTTPSDTAAALALAQRAATTPTPTGLDRIMQRAAARIVPMLQAGDGAGAAKLAKVLLPFGTLG